MKASGKRPHIPDTFAPILVSHPEGEVVVTVPCPLGSEDLMVRAFMEWSRRYSLSAWSLHFDGAGASCLLLLQMAEPCQSHCSRTASACGVMRALVTSWDSHSLRYGIRQVEEVLEVEIVEQLPLIGLKGQ